MGIYDFAHGCIAAGEPEIAAVAVICFEWLQRPENVIAGYIKWSDYRAPSAPTIIRMAHHKTGTVAPHPLEEALPDGTAIKFYADAEEVLAALPRRGVSMILREVSKGVAKPFAFPTMQHKVQRMRKKLGLPAHFKMDACRHKGMTELEEAELTDGQVCLSKIKSEHIRGAIRRGLGGKECALPSSRCAIGARPYPRPSACASHYSSERKIAADGGDAARRPPQHGPGNRVG
jgi:hypothetical protein